MNTYPQGAPVSALFDHITYSFDKVKNPKHGLQCINCFIKVGSGSLALKQLFFLDCQVVSNRRDRLVKSCDLVFQVDGIGPYGQQSRHRGHEILETGILVNTIDGVERETYEIVVTTYLLNFSFF